MRLRWFGFWFALATFQVIGAAAHPVMADEIDVDFEPRRMRMQCYGPSTWAQIASCLKQTSPSLAIGAHPTAHTQLVVDKTAPLANGGFVTRMYVQRLDGKWYVVRTIDSSATVVGEKTMPVEGSKQGAIRIELREQTRFQNGRVRTLLRLRTAIVCQTDSCLQLTYNCAYLENGRGISMLMGSVVAKSGTVIVDADRTFATGGACDR